MNRNTRLGLLAAAAVVAVVAFVVAQGAGGGKHKTSTQRSSAGPVQTAVTTIRVRHAKPVGGVAKISVTHGQPVRFRVVSDTADEIHVHGYDFHKDVAANGSVSFDFPAKIEGLFVIELEKHSEQIASLEVTP